MGLAVENSRAFHDKAVALGAEFRTPVKVTSIDKSGEHWQVTTDSGMIETDIVVNCAGAWGAQIAKMTGDILPIEAHAPMLVITDRAISEVGAVIIVGGNIDHLTRVMTTAIALETSKGELEFFMRRGDQ